MTWPITFANLAAGPQPLADFDTMFNAVGAASIIACTATGSNTVVLTPKANYYTPVAYSDGGPVYTWVQQTTCTGAVTINAAGLGALAAFRNNGATQIAAGDLVAGQTYFACTQQSLNSNAGGFVVFVEQAQIPSVSSFFGGASGTYTPPAGTRYLTVMGAGGGGGGAGSGGAGVGGGGNGGATTFGTITAGGGGGCAASANAFGAAAGASGPFTWAWNGGQGGSSVGNTAQVGGVGGGTALGGGGTPGTATIVNGLGGNLPPNPTGAGGGGASSGSTAGSGGGGGGAGVFYLLTSTVAATAYSVGNGGAGGAAGTGGSAGGAGSGGGLWITAFF